MFKFLHAADIHLDSPLKGLERYEGAPVDDIRGATRRALENLVALAIEEEVAFVLIVGDLYDGDWRDYNTGLFFVKQMASLREADIPVYLVSGNHDAQSKMTKNLPMPDNVRWLSARKPETVQLEEFGVALHGQGFEKQAVTENLAISYPDGIPGLFNIGLLHTCAEGREGHEPYAPCLPRELLAKNYSYWALGHVHKRETIHDDPPIRFPGNTQGRNVRELGPKGCLVVSADPSANAEAEFHALDILRWQVCDIDASTCDTEDDVLDAFTVQIKELLRDSDNRMLALRVVVTGASKAHDVIAAKLSSFANAVRATANDYGRDTVWVEKVQIRSGPLRLIRAAETDGGPVGELLQLIKELHDNDANLVEVGQCLDSLSSDLPVELREEPDALNLKHPDKLREILEHVKPMLLNRLLHRVGSA